MQEELLHIFPLHLRETLQKVTMKENTLEEIRIRIGQPVIFHMENEEWYLKKETGRLERSQVNAYCATKEDIKSMVKFISSYSLYAYEDEIRRGFITVRGGHRIGVAGQAAVEQGRIKSISCVSSLNIRISHQIKGCGTPFFSYLWQEENPCHTLIISPPGGGKTTLLRDFIRLFSNGFSGHPGVSVALIDERSEVGACHMGVPQNDVGIRTDVMANCPKAAGIEMMVRAMGPQMVAFDELGGKEDLNAVNYAVHSGCRVLTTIHGSRPEDVEQRCGKSLFERYVFLDGWQRAGHVCRILDCNGRTLYKAV